MQSRQSRHSRPGPARSRRGLTPAPDERHRGANKKLFRDLGITVPANFAFTQEQFKG